MSCPSVINSKKFITLNMFDWRGQAQLSEAKRKTNVTPAFILIQTAQRNSFLPAVVLVR